MKKLLHVIASPRGETSRTLQVATAFLRQFREIHPDWLVDEINLFHEPLPPLTARQVDGKYVLLGGRELYGELRETWEEIEHQIERFKAAEAYLISTPMWNFGVPYILKQYIDILIQPRYLFRYVKGRPEGLLTGRRMVVISSRGGEYTSPADLLFDHVEPHLRAVFGFVGITDVRFVKVEPLDGVSAKAVEDTIEAARGKAREAAEWISR
ncbi:MAG: NAD(P)H-dependent oxidoreductase [bacterium]